MPKIDDISKWPKSVLWAALVSILLAGCSGEEPRTYPVSGQVLLDGEPIGGAVVMLQPNEGSFGYGVTEPNGKFVISTFEVGDGAIPGEHGIIVTMQEMAIFPGGTPPDAVKEVNLDPGIQIPERYGKAATSGLSVTVTKNLDPLELKLNSQ